MIRQSKVTSVLTAFVFLLQTVSFPLLSGYGMEAKAQAASSSSPSPSPGPRDAASGAAADAIFWQAVALELGRNGTKDAAGAIRLYQQAARQGSGASMVRLGYLLQSGNGVPQDLPGAFALYRQAADTGDPEGQFMYALCYAEGVGTGKDSVTARKLLLLPADAGHQDAQYVLGIMIALGEGGPKREASARRWLDKAASGPDHDLAVRAASQRDKIDKNLFSPDNSGAAMLAGIAAFVIMAGSMSGGGGGDGGGAGVVNNSYPTRSTTGTSASTAPRHPTPTPMNGDITKTLHGDLGGRQNVRFH